MLCTKQLFTSFQKAAETDVVNINVTYFFDDGQVFFGNILGSDSDLTVNAQNNGKITWDEQDIADIHQIELPASLTAILVEKTATFTAIQAATAAAALGQMK